MPDSDANHPGHAEAEYLPPAARLLNRQWIGVSDAGEVTVAFEAKPEFTNRHGTVQGGFLAAMLDSATALTLLVALPSDKTVVTKRLDTTFVSPARPGRLVAYANLQSRDERGGTVVALLKSADGVVVARATAELRVLARKANVPEGPPLNGP